MEEIIQLVVEKTGISEDKARTAVETVISQLSKRMDGPLAAQLQGMLGGKTGEGALGAVSRGVGGMLNK